MEAILHGFILAFGLILPLGVQNVFVFTQGAAQLRLSRAMPAVLAASLCDTLLILLAVFGVSAVVLKFEALRIALMLAGVLFLAYMGLSLWRSKPAAWGSSDNPGTPGNGNGTDGAEAPPRALPASKQMIFAISVSLLNPHALLDTIGVIGTSALVYEGPARLRFAAACAAVSWVWFAGLAGAGAVLRRFDGSGRWMALFNKGSALFIWGTALYLLWSLA
ncbi:LysE/ArgO family amino acid transporter [Saccharibacillus alkalitolerans]|uniref:LysE family transporter n=1 Tax=Saccharibacillus alkalitolerans TaxID=2705290 RepID=A0ABX0F5Q2_9BACL|nr:LysE family transporter [Saccharibacillus alkalitolerans]NGZ76282.1 LysE family transporter [Saccharibacillus alkalitolerans]